VPWIFGPPMPFKWSCISYPVAPLVLLVYMIRHHCILWQCRLHDHASSYSVASIQPISVCSPSCRRCRRVCIFYRAYAQQPAAAFFFLTE
jgi:hypothetical protein